MGLHAVFRSFKPVSVGPFFFRVVYLHRIVFWDSRIAASSLRQSDTRLPDVPDQSSFLAEWFDWHRGYKTIPKENGTTEQLSLRTESLSHMPPGRLPISGDEPDTSSAIDNNIHHTSQSLSDLHIDTGVGTFASPRSRQSLEIDPDDRLFDSPPSLPSSAMDLDPIPPVPAVDGSFAHTFTRSQLQSLSANSNPRIQSFTGGSDNHMSESNSAAGGTSSSIGTSNNALQLQQLRDRQATLLRHGDRAEASRIGHEQSSGWRAAIEASRTTELDLRRIQQRITQHQSSARVFGTRDELERQGADYVSPLTDLFRNASRPATEPANNINGAAIESDSTRSTRLTPRPGYALPPIPAYRGDRVSRNPTLSGFHHLSEERDAQRTQNMTTQDHGPGAIYRGSTARGRSRRNSRRSGQAPTTATELGSSNDEYTSLPAHTQRRNQAPIAAPDARQAPQVTPRRRVHSGSDAFRPPPFVRNTQEDRQEWHRAEPLGGEATLHDARAAWMYHSDSEGRLYATVNPFTPQPVSGNHQPQQGQRPTTNLNHNHDDPPTLDLQAIQNMHPDAFRQFHRLLALELQHHERMQQIPQTARPAVTMPRPPPLTTEQMMVERQCKICWEQLATVATLPCGMSLAPSEVMRVSTEH